MVVLYFFATYLLFVGLFGGLLAARLGLLAAEDKGALVAAHVNGAYALINRKTSREAGFRFISACFSVFVGLVIFLTPHPANVVWRPTGTAVFVALCALKTSNCYVSMLDLRDRDLIVKGKVDAATH